MSSARAEAGPTRVAQTITFVAVALWFALVVFSTLAPRALAGVCTSSISGPNDPDYAPAERGFERRPSFNTEQWYLFDCIPQSARKAKDPEGAAGMSVNEAWKTFDTLGRSDVVVAYIEGGINWRLTGSADLRKKAYLNCGELPAPEDAAGKTEACSSPGCSAGCREPDNVYDLDGDGVLTVDDYAHDPRIKQPLLHQSTAGGITAEDLIRSFSDGTDDDHNGYVDDISGWNFHRDTNDPQTDNSVYGHPDGESNQIAAEANNPIGGAGLCPNCRLLSIKAGDEAIDRPDRLAEAVAFAVDSGAKVILGVSSSLGQSPSLRGAIDYAYNHGVVIAWASNDFESADHTDGMRFAHVWPGNSIVSDRSNRSGSSNAGDSKAHTFRSRSSLTSYGPHALFSVPNNDGSTSTGTPTVGGVAAMVISAGLDAFANGEITAPLDANEVEQVVRATASSINYKPCATCFAGLRKAEFNIQYGYGRPNVFKAMLAVHAGTIPPTADIISPDWYAEVDPTSMASLPVDFKVAAQRANPYTWQVQYGLGPQPLDKSFKTFDSGSRTTAQELMSSLDLAKIPHSFWSGKYVAPTKNRLSIERYDVTLRVVVTDKNGLVGEDRRVFHLRHESAELPGFPMYLRTSLEVGATMADIEGRGVLDTIVAGSDGSVHAIRPDGTEAPGFPVMTNLARGVDPSYSPNYLGATSWSSGQIPLPHDGISGPIAVGDLNHDGRLEIVATSFDGFVYVWDGAGNLLPGFPVSTDRSVAQQSVPPPDTPYSTNPMTGQFGGVALGDLEETRKLDIVMAGWDGQIYAWRPDGTPVPGWPVDATDISDSAPPNTTFATDYKIANTPTLVDINGNGHPDVLVGLQDTAFPVPSMSPVTGFLTGFSSAGILLPNFPVQLQGLVQGYGTATDLVTEGVQTPAALTLESGPIAVANPDLYLGYVVDLRSGQPKVETPAVIKAAGTSTIPPVLIHFTTSASIGNLLGKKTPQIVQAGTAAPDLAAAVTTSPGTGVKIRNFISAWDPATGRNLSKYTQMLQGLPFFAAPAIADVSGDGRPDILIATDSAAIHAFDGRTGRPVRGWPKWTGGFALSTPAVGDLTGSGTVDVAVTTREGYLHIYSTPGKASANHEAWHWHQNDRNTGHYGDDTRPPSAISDLMVTLGGNNSSNDTLQFTAVGDDWKSGTAAKYEIFAASAPITQDNVASATLIASPSLPKPAGSLESIAVPHQAGLDFYAVRAIDKAGNIGPLPVK
jgi:Subtilase family